MGGLVWETRRRTNERHRAFRRVVADLRSLSCRVGGRHRRVASRLGRRDPGEDGLGVSYRTFSWGGMVMRHGGPCPVPVEVLTAPDPDLYLVNADMSVWLAAHPCSCEGLCECGDEKETKI